MSGNAAAVLPGAVREVLRSAAVVVAERSTEPLDPDRVVTESQGVATLLALLEQSAGLRAEVAARYGQPCPEQSDGGELAACLLAPDTAAASRGVASVRGLLSSARRAARRAAREVERSERAPVAQREEERAARRLKEVRAARDRAQVQARQAEAEAAELRAELVELASELAAVTGRAEVAETRLNAARLDAADPVRAAAALASALMPQIKGRLHDSRGVGPGEPTRVDPGRPPPAQAVDPERVTAAARIAGLPDDIAGATAMWLPALLRAFITPPRPVAQVRGRELRVEVLGGGTEIGGSCVLITAGDTRLLIDAGTRPGAVTFSELAPPGIERAFDGPLHGVVVTHAHNDHAGWVPAVLIRRPDTPVLVTDATAALLSTMWFDSSKVLARRSVEADGTGPPVPYGKDDVRHALDRMRPLPFGRRHRLGTVDIELFQAGHIVGAAGVIVHAGDQRVVVSGDVSRPGQRTVGGIEVPDAARGADLLLLESTYANSRRMPPRAAEAAQLISDVATVTSSGGRVLIPAFALGRAQEVALTLAEGLPEVDVLIDGLARSVASVYEQQPAPDGGPLRIFGPRVRAVPPGGTRDAIGNLRSGVVIATSGMLTAGPAVAWAKALLPDPAAGLMVVGYQDEDSPGARLLELARTGGGEFELPNFEGELIRVPVRAQVNRYGLGAHANADELVAISADIGAHEVMLVHGERHNQATFATRLSMRGQAIAPTGHWSSAQ
ncbi:MBL fold metallo-hydrolase [Crossiella cryophila]|uniref:Cft2 family RNA processing exonuclease n=1 Tax=Crossiella cryophila TaxID=43355 RepID=A0A7W7FSR4_9PSEU|nr:MBL fold metallo-hydrolase [Crossiella cryophila]MBB4675668.1 Cft2 family RNA processing exonuclease [Crossiella cryophila]